MKTMIICYFDSRELIPPGQTVNQTYYSKVLHRLRKRVNRVLPNIAQTWFLNHDNMPICTVFSVTQFLTSKGIAEQFGLQVCRYQLQLTREINKLFH